MAGLEGSRRWQVLPASDADEARLVAELGCTPLVARVLVARGLADPDAARAFLTPSLERDWEDPLLIPGMQEAADRVELALADGETIAVFGDFDVDGMSATSLLTLGLRALGGNVYPFIPDRFDEGYGLSEVALSRVVEACHPKLIITVDNGISAGNEVRELLDAGIDVVITDHHEPGDLVPQGVPVADPKCDPACPSHELAGVGVALKLVCELGRRFEKPELWRSFTELACLGTVSDMMLLTGENRALVADGIAHMRHSTRPGIAALAATAGTDLSRITADALPFSLVPRLNAAGRMGQTDVAFRLLFTDDLEEAAVLAGKLEAINTERRQIEAALSEEAMAQAQEGWQGGRVVVVAGEGWHEGVKGIVASRLTNRFHVPAIVFSLVDGEARGSGRSVGSVDLFHTVEQCADLTIRFGGHAGAVGVTVPADGVDAFRARLEQVLEALPAEQFESCEEVAAQVRLGELNVASIGALEVLQPFGQGNKKPYFAARGVTMRNRVKAGVTGNHLRFVASDGMASVPAIMFRVPDVDRAVATDGVVDLVFEAVNETWQGRTKAKLMVKDILYRDAAPAQDAAAAEGEPLPAVAGPTPAPVPAPNPAELAGLSYQELTDRLVRALIGEHRLLPAQAAALDQLAQGNSTLLVMATGRGKSLVFHVHAAREALLRKRASVFVYPLRALVADQVHHLQDRFERLGIGVRTLTGATPKEDRAIAWSELSCGRCGVVLTTPEFLSIHAEQFARTGRIGFLVVDEAHHAAHPEGGRVAYSALPRVRALLGDPVTLAVTATATTDDARRVCDLLGIDAPRVLVDSSVRHNLRVMDCRGMRDRDAALVSLVARGEKCVVYVNSREECASLVRMLRHNVADLADRIGFYHAGLTRERRGMVEDAFREGRLCCIVSTSAFGEGVDVPDVRHVVLYHLPFDRTEFNQTSGRAGRDGNEATVWLLFGSGDAQINERVLAAGAPSRDELVTLWRALRQATAGQAGEVAVDPQWLSEAACQVDRRCSLDAHAVMCGIGVFSELGFLQYEPAEDGLLVQMEVAPAHMRLTDSARYVEGLRATDAFAAFRDWALGSSAQQLLEGINRPIVPDFGCVVDGESRF